MGVLNTWPVVLDAVSDAEPELVTAGTVSPCALAARRTPEACTVGGHTAVPRLPPFPTQTPHFFGAADAGALPCPAGDGRAPSGSAVR